MVDHNLGLELGAPLMWALQSNYLYGHQATQFIDWAAATTSAAAAMEGSTLWAPNVVDGSSTATRAWTTDDTTAVTESISFSEMDLARDTYCDDGQDLKSDLIPILCDLAHDSFHETPSFTGYECDDNGVLDIDPCHFPGTWSGIDCGISNIPLSMAYRDLYMQKFPTPPKITASDVFPAATLIFYDVSYNTSNGDAVMTDWICAFPIVYVIETDVTGAIPTCGRESGSNTDIIYISGTKVTSLPSTLFPYAKEIGIFQNSQLTGGIPDYSVGPEDESFLETLYLYDNDLTGAIPATLCCIPTLSLLSMGGNAGLTSYPQCLKDLSDNLDDFNVFGIFNLPVNDLEPPSGCRFPGETNDDNTVEDDDDDDDHHDYYDVRGYVSRTYREGSCESPGRVHSQTAQSIGCKPTSEIEWVGEFFSSDYLSSLYGCSQKANGNVEISQYLFTDDKCQQAKCDPTIPCQPGGCLLKDDQCNLFSDDFTPPDDDYYNSNNDDGQDIFLLQCNINYNDTSSPGAYYQCENKDYYYKAPFADGARVTYFLDTNYTNGGTPAFPASTCQDTIDNGNNPDGYYIDGFEDTYSTCGWSSLPVDENYDVVCSADYKNATYGTGKNCSTADDLDPAPIVEYEVPIDVCYYSNEEPYIYDDDGDGDDYYNHYTNAATSSQNRQSVQSDFNNLVGYLKIWTCLIGEAPTYSTTYSWSVQQTLEFSIADWNSNLVNNEKYFTDSIRDIYAVEAVPGSPDLVTGLTAVDSSRRRLVQVTNLRARRLSGTSIALDFEVQVLPGVGNDYNDGNVYTAINAAHENSVTGNCGGANQPVCLTTDMQQQAAAAGDTTATAAYSSLAVPANGGLVAGTPTTTTTNLTPTGDSDDSLDATTIAGIVCGVIGSMILMGAVWYAVMLAKKKEPTLKDKQTDKQAQAGVEIKTKNPIQSKTKEGVHNKL
jgi:hypothetical protein